MAALNVKSVAQYKTLLLNQQIAQQRVEDFLQAQALALEVDPATHYFDDKALAFAPRPSVDVGVAPQ